MAVAAGPRHDSSLYGGVSGPRARLGTGKWLRDSAVRGDKQLRGCRGGHGAASGFVPSGQPASVEMD